MCYPSQLFQYYLIQYDPFSYVKDKQFIKAQVLRSQFDGELNNPITALFVAQYKYVYGKMLAEGERDDNYQLFLVDKEN